MKMSNSVYTFIKYLCAVALPAVNTAILALAQVFSWDWGSVVSQVIVIANTLLAALFCITIANYNASAKVDTATGVVEIGDFDDDIDDDAEDDSANDDEEEEESSEDIDDDTTEETTEQ